MKLRTAAIALFTFSLMTVLCFFTVSHYHFIVFSSRPTSDPEFVMYRLDDVYRVVIQGQAALLINTKERVVVRLGASSGRWLGPVLFWPHDARGVVLGDGVQGDVRDSYHYADGGVDIRFGSATEKHDVHVTL